MCSCTFDQVPSWKERRDRELRSAPMLPSSVALASSAAAAERAPPTVAAAIHGALAGPARSAALLLPPSSVHYPPWLPPSTAFVPAGSTTPAVVATADAPSLKKGVQERQYTVEQVRRAAHLILSSARGDQRMLDATK